MTKQEIIYMASKCLDKGWDYERLLYSDDMCKKPETLTDEVWGYVTECQQIGILNFKKKYSDFKLFF